MYFPLVVFEAKQCHQAARVKTEQLGPRINAAESHEVEFPMAEVRTNLMSKNESFLSRSWRRFSSKSCPQREKTEVICGPAV